jgi:hypothetical protein
MTIKLTGVVRHRGHSFASLALTKQVSLQVMVSEVSLTNNGAVDHLQ